MNTSQTSNEKLVDTLHEIKRQEKELAKRKAEITSALKERAAKYGTRKIEGSLAVATVFTQERDSVAYSKLTDELKEQLQAGGYVNHTTATILKLRNK